MLAFLKLFQELEILTEKCPLFSKGKLRINQ